MSIAWSHTALKMYENCPRKYHEVRVLKRYPIIRTEAILYGDRLHAAADAYAKGKPMAPEFGFMVPIVDAMLKKEGEVHTELKFALSGALAPRSWYDKDVWVRAIADLLVIDRGGKRAWIVDWKTGKDKYPDRDQLEIMALCVFALYPDIDEVRSALVFVVKGSVFKDTYKRAQADALWWKYRERVARIDAAHASGIWNPQKSGLCGYCEVLTCEMNPKGE